MSEEDVRAAWVTRLVDAVTRGTIVDLRSGVPAYLYDPATADRWPVDRHIPARAIREVLAGDHTGFSPCGLRIVGARITGDVDFAHITFDFPLHLIRCRIDQPMNLNNVRLRQLSLSGSHLLSLDLDEANIAGGLLADRIATCGEVRAIGATIKGRLDLDDAHLRNSGHDVLSLHNATISGGLFARRIITDGAIRALDATIDSQLNLHGAQLHNPGQDVLALDRATITGGLVADRIITDGEIRALGTSINGQLDLDDAHLRNCGQDVLSLHRATLSGGLLARRIITDGAIRALGTTITGRFDLEGALLHNPGLDVLDLAGATINGGLVARCITTNGSIRAVSATINGELDLKGSHLYNPAHDVLELAGATVTGPLVAGDAATGGGAVAAFRADGVISARGARFENCLEFRAAKLRLAGTDRPMIDLEGGVVRELSLPAEGPAFVDLSRAKVTHLTTPDDREPRYPVRATGWEIGDIEGRIRTDRAAATRWLSRAQGWDVSPQPWHALAAVYERNGHPAEGRRLRFTAANKVTKSAPWASKQLRRLYLVFAGHGYYPLLAAVWLIVALAGGFALVEMSREHFVPTSPSAATTVITIAADTTGGGEGAPVEIEQSRTITGADDCATHPQYPCLDSFSYALTGVIPAATGVVRPDWTISTAAPWWVKAGIPALRCAAWLFTAILLAGVTGLLRKSS